MKRLNPEELNDHIESLTPHDWERLFKFISPGDPDDAAYDFCELMYELKLVINFDWAAWTEGREIVKNGHYKNLDRITLFKILTAIIRNDRFSEGVLVCAFENGTIERILVRLKERLLCI